ncbi:LIC_13387 family protein [Edaphobacter bradus]|uniref:LIC_13387 family protein n=1 Tax=Edaphobacter bradus TaxID=2259016 RepID=UPI0021DFC932|nr:hypothetical protein [Edaphobacter bradus]
MRPAAWLRVAAVLTLIHAVLHTVGGVYGAQDPGPQTVAATAMKANTFVVFGNVRSFWTFYRGMGLVVTVLLTLEAVVFWLLGGLAKTEGVRLRPVVLVFAVGYVALAVVSWGHFFLGPVITELLIAACLGVAAPGLAGQRVSKSAAELLTR